MFTISKETGVCGHNRISIQQPKRLCGKVIAEPKELIRMVETRKSELNGI
jgi:hypothetical protein